MTKKKCNSEKPTRRFCAAKDGEIIRKLYATTPNAELAKLRELTTEQVKEFARREKSEERSGRWAMKSPAYLSKIRSICGKMGGRQRKKTK